MSNPFEQPASQQPAAPPANPYAQQPTPFGPGVQTQQQAPVAPAPQAYAPAPAPQAYAPAPAPQAAPPAFSPGGVTSAPPPPPAGEGRGAKLVHMYGRLVLIFPLAIARRPRNPQFITAEQRARGDLEQDQLTATIVVLDDGQVNPGTGVGGMSPITFGGDPTALPAVPDNESAPLPYVRRAMWITQSRVVAQLRDFLPSSPGTAPGMVVGRFVKTGPQRNDPWYLQGATQAELNLANQYLGLVQNRVYPHPLADA